MKIEIWSDVMCPYCYIAKRKYEEALGLFENAGQIETIWRSFLLDPDVRFQAGRDAFGYLASRKGKSIEWSRQAHRKVAAMAKDAGLDYNFDRAIPASSFDAHRLSHLARQHSLQNEVEERLFSAYFTEGKNIEDHETLVQIGGDAGLDRGAIRTMLAGSEFSDDVRREAAGAAEMGAGGVPFFVMDDRYEVPGLQSAEVFLKFIRLAWAEQEPAVVPEVESGTHHPHIPSDVMGSACSVNGCGPEF